MYDPTGLTILVLFGVVILALSILARRTGTNAPVLLILGGVALALVPTIARLQVPPELVVLIFLPALLYWESLTTSLRKIRRDLRSLVLSSVFLVLATAAAVAAAAHYALGMDWAVAFVLGAIVAPTDATAVTAVARDLPRRQLTMLRAESLVNDGTALVVFSVALGVATGQEEFRVLGALGDFAISYLGGIAVGALVAWLAVLARRIAADPMLVTVVSVLTPFVAFLLAEEIHASGVLAVVVCGLGIARVGPRITSARARVLVHSFWQVTTFLLNAALFVLVGMQLPRAISTVSSRSVAAAVGGALLVAVVVVATRFVWFFTVPYVIRTLDRRPAQRARRIGARGRLPLAWSGFRGAVSLAIALAVPLTTTAGTPFPERDLLIVLALGVILVTLVGQGLTLPAVIRFGRFGPDTAFDDEVLLARRRTLDAALVALPRLAAERAVPEALARRVRAEQEHRLHILDPAHGTLDDDLDDAAEDAAMERDLRVALLDERRRVLLALRDESVIDDAVVLRVQAELDNEELGLRGAPGPE
ncbi:Na+/H+ antiporter [Actinomycetospora sp. TBRC 11914]|uniref:Na+/H+ antiporter n=1 Tax=Actinomycetospora sp. TBRC 11914 TaxID=2729387 RepID=UPI00145F3622|nr:Na+/H+ antiporter [Actinomycetospora sp. TBRC 11914]NMO88283.1 Na+/H+ antiporter [Actinomycetospora sp. TBRC 11914]